MALIPSLTQVAGRAAAAAAGTWERLSRGQPNPGRFAPVMAAGLPESACRWLTHAIVPGTPLARAVIVEMEGHIRLGRWLTSGLSSSTPHPMATCGQREPASAP